MKNDSIVKDATVILKDLSPQVGEEGARYIGKVMSITYDGYITAMVPKFNRLRRISPKAPTQWLFDEVIGDTSMLTKLEKLIYET
jgi:hypothetical protein